MSDDVETPNPDSIPDIDDSGSFEIYEALSRTMPGTRRVSASPPSSEDAPSSHSDEDVVDAWNDMALRMVQVIKTIRVNEKKLEATRKHISRTLFANGVAALVVVVGALYGGFAADNVERNIAAKVDQGHEHIQGMAESQAATLKAVTALGKALAASLEAEATLDPDAEDKAADAAVEAQRKSLEAEKQLANNPADKAHVDRQLKSVEQNAKRRKPLRRKFE